ncbi:hypothetical protein PAPYR_6970 [Paratrimastix pyriformis]|uniref:Cyclin N-terminal domain-containing protein n=1 Tax=Paratrimastix pyriformis TaxID=342808 RepID=A0ABQ8UDY2_9EUKA|nr:hypothetical protein PAPYR_6970 [Paratrimastix pyriformis]
MASTMSSTRSQTVLASSRASKTMPAKPSPDNCSAISLLKSRVASSRITVSPSPASVTPSPDYSIVRSGVTPNNAGDLDTDSLYTPLSHVQFPPSQSFRKAVADMLLSLRTPSAPEDRFRPENEAFRNDPTCHLYTWIQHIHAMTRLPDSICVTALCYLYKIRREYPTLVISDINVHRLFGMGCLIACKMLEDACYVNRQWAIVFENRWTVAQVNTMELEMMSLLHWNASVSVEYFEAMFSAITSQRCSPVNVLG